MIGIVKAYTTRVGEGPFPTELHDDAGEHLRKIGAEYGTTTGRPRRCGWYDAVIARYAARVNGVTDFVLTKLDVLTGLEQVPVCVAYDVDGVRHDEMPVDQSAFHHAVPIYEYLPGWWEDISEARTVDDLPANARAYVETVEAMSGARISVVGVGPERTAVDRAPRPRADPVTAGDPVKVLVVGPGGREHALARALAHDPAVSEVHVAPGNPGIAAVATRHEVDAMDGDAVAALATSLGAGLVVVGPGGAAGRRRRRRRPRRRDPLLRTHPRGRAARGLEGLRQGGHGRRRRPHRPGRRLHHGGGGRRRPRPSRARPTW